MYQASRLIAAARSNARGAIQENGDPRNRFLWHSRGYLPHFEGGETTQIVSFHLSDSLPHTALRRMEARLNSVPAKHKDVERRKRIDALMDAGLGSCILRKPQVAEMIEHSLLSFDSRRYRLLEWVVMPNHIHVLFQPMDDWTVAKIVSSWKKFTARMICHSARLGGETAVIPVWHREYWDRYIRNQSPFDKAVDYIRSNPVKADLIRKPENWPWSSARFSLGSPIS